MPIQAQSADGAMHEFPDGTPDHVVDAAMKDYAGKPTIDDKSYPSWMAQRHGVDPQTVRDLMGSQVGTEGLKGIPILGGLVDKAGAGASSLAQPLTGAGVPGGSIGERYGKNLALQSEIGGDFERAHPVLSGASKAVGGIAATGIAGSTALGARALGMGAQTLPGQMAAMGASGAGIGAADAAVRGQDPLAAGTIGGLIGAALPPAARGLGAVASPIVSNIMARVNPTGYAASQVARGLMESGQTPAQIDAALAAANREGQGGVYTAADAMGNAGQRLLSTVARAPGEGRTAVVDALEARQAGQGRRVAGQLAQGFQVPETAAATEARLTGARDTAADTAYGAVRNDAAPVDLSPAIARIDMTLQPGATGLATPQSGLAPDSIEAALTSLRNRLTDGRSQLTDFTAMQRVRGDLADQVQAAVRGGQGNRARLLGGVLRQMDAAMEQASPGFRAANANYAQASRNIEAVDQGRTAAMRGRTEDTIPAFNALPPPAQAAFRSGYVDPLIAQTQAAAVGANKARPLINDAFQAESTAMAPGAARMQSQLAREQTMFETRAHALGGSRTADNLADQAAMGVDPTIIAHALSGNHMGVLRGLMNSTANALTGNTAAVRQQIARILLSRGDMPAGTIQRAVDQTMRRIEQNRRAVQAGMVGGRTLALIPNQDTR